MAAGDGIAARAKAIDARTPELTVDLWLCATVDGGRTTPVAPGWGCPCRAEGPGASFWDGFPILGERAMAPGERRRVGFVFLSGEPAAAALRGAGRFLLWEGRVIGEAVVVPS
ncbi:hypothetical protein SAMN06265365_10928 [Tistlia consotensis]|uniref:Uncharacterized protein n=1 Tax=Tistlia consotensis USBA 355 TaxID=560819 RepID=A0A1Y6CV43_9PROT|nr:hypothetical protein [Tistlia consotensis]SMF80351.1 hypothetical protein SAMN05428998_14128 [Tistlia consotensis USBA 355]SNR62569.1 hypothetical protein SAMN06265365_10928 [Tistlia consotensis]